MREHTASAARRLGMEGDDGYAPAAPAFHQFDDFLRVELRSSMRPRFADYPVKHDGTVVSDLGQSVNRRFSAFNQRTTPEIVGSLSRISADISQDQKTGMSYYLGRVSLSSAELSKLAGLKLLPGMPVEAFVRTEDRTVLSYMVKPLHDQIAKAFRER